MRHKTTQIAFAIVLLILSVVSTIMDDEIITNIIFSVVVPSFILSLISFIDEIMELCEQAANDLSKNCFELSSKHLEIAKKQAVENNGTDPNFLNTFHAILDLSQSIHASGDSYSAAKAIFEKYRNILWKSSVVGYVLLFLSLIFSPYITERLPKINLDCLTLWSLAMFYISLEFKPWLAKKIVIGVAQRIKKKQKTIASENRT